MTDNHDGRLKTRFVTGDPRELTLLDKNARFMTKTEFARLVANVRRDGVLTSTPLVWNDADNDRKIVLSGNHRTMAAIEAGLPEITWQEIDQPLPRQRQIAIQISHNAISGQDDPATLKELYEEIESIEWREFAGLDDKQMDLLAKVNPESMSEANLDFATVQIIFLPSEKDRAEQALEQAMTAPVDSRWVTVEENFDKLLDALHLAKTATDVVSTPVGFGVILDVFERHVTDLADAWYDPATGTHLEGRSTAKWVPLQTILGTLMPPDSAAIVKQAVDRLIARGDVNPKAPWQALEQWAADTLAGED